MTQDRSIYQDIQRAGISYRIKRVHGRSADYTLPMYNKIEAAERLLQMRADRERYGDVLTLQQRRLPAWKNTNY